MLKTARILLASVPLLALSLACGNGASTDDDDDDDDNAIVDSVGPRFDCTAQRYYCDALDRFRDGQTPAATTTAYSLIGRAYRSGLGEEVDWFVARPGEQMSNGEITPDNPDEAQQLTEVLGLLRNGQPVPPGHPVAQFVQSLATGGSPPQATELRGRSRWYRSPDGRDVYVRQNGNEIIVVESHEEDASIGVFVRP